MLSKIENFNNKILCFPSYDIIYEILMENFNVIYQLPI